MHLHVINISLCVCVCMCGGGGGVGIAPILTFSLNNFKLGSGFPFHTHLEQIVNLPCFALLG